MTYQRSSGNITSHDNGPRTMVLNQHSSTNAPYKSFPSCPNLHLISTSLPVYPNPTSTTFPLNLNLPNLFAAHVELYKNTRHFFIWDVTLKNSTLLTITLTQISGLRNTGNNITRCFSVQLLQPYTMKDK